MESGSGFEFIKIWSKLGRRVSPPPKELRVWIWFRRNVLLNDKLRVKFQVKSSKPLLVSIAAWWNSFPKDWAKYKIRSCQRPSALRNDGTRTSKGSFLAILKQLHRTHLHPSLPFTIISTPNGLGIRSRTSQFGRLANTLTGHARLVPVKLIPQSISSPHEGEDYGPEQKLLSALREYVSVIKLSSRELFIVWGPLALVNHSCNSQIGFEAGFGEGYVPKVGKTYSWGLRKLDRIDATSRELARKGKEILAFYGNCEGETDFICDYCLYKNIKMETISWWPIWQPTWHFVRSFIGNMICIGGNGLG